MERKKRSECPLSWRSNSGLCKVLHRPTCCPSKDKCTGFSSNLLGDIGCQRGPNPAITCLSRNQTITFCTVTARHGMGRGELTRLNEELL
jgi:hypothetical protein